LDTNTDFTGSFSNFQVWVLPGMTSQGNETNMALWTQVATGSGTGAGLNNPTHVTLSNPIPLNAGTLYGIAVIADPAFAHFYTNGTGSNQNYSNADLALFLGSATNVPFTAPVFSPRVWNGTIYYTGGPCGGSPTPTPTPTATGSCTPSSFHVLIAYSDTTVPTQLQSEILAEPGVAAVDLFDAQAGTPTLGQLQQYQIVVPYSNFPFLDADTLGNNLADYVDGGGVVVQYGFSHYGPSQPYGVNGRWVSGNYNPYTYSQNLEFNAFSLGTFNAGHPLMAGVTMLNSNFANVVTLASGATEVAANNLGELLVAFRPVGGHTTVGVTAYVGAASTQSGDWGKVIVNAGNWLANCQGGTPTPTPTGTPGGCQVTGSIDTGDPTQTDRLFRSGIPQTCPASTTCAIFGDPTPRHYDSYTFTNTTGATQCVTVNTDTACTGTNFTFVAAYLGSFDPNNICTNWIGDSGSSPDVGVPVPFSFNVDNGQTFVVVISEVTPNSGCPAYTLTITPQSICGGGVSPTPTATATATTTATATATPTATVTSTVT